MATLAILVLLHVLLPSSHAHDIHQAYSQKVYGRILLQDDTDNTSVIAMQVPEADQYVTPQARQPDVYVACGYNQCS